MPLVCSICKHDSRRDIDMALIKNDSLRNIAERFKVSTTALHRHRHEHLPELLKKARDAADVDHADKLLGEVTHLLEKSLGILNKAENAGDMRTALLAVRESRSCIELSAQLTGRLRNQNLIAAAVQVVVRLPDRLPSTVFPKIEDAVVLEE